MFRKSYVHHQEVFIVNAALYGRFFTRLCKESGRLKDVLLVRSMRCSKHVEDKKNWI